MPQIFLKSFDNTCCKCKKYYRTIFSLLRTVGMALLKMSRVNIYIISCHYYVSSLCCGLWIAKKAKRKLFTPPDMLNCVKTKQILAPRCMIKYKKALQMLISKKTEHSTPPFKIFWNLAIIKMFASELDARLVNDKQRKFHSTNK